MFKREEGVIHGAVKIYGLFPSSSFCSDDAKFVRRDPVLAERNKGLAGPVCRQALVQRHNPAALFRRGQERQFVIREVTADRFYYSECTLESIFIIITLFLQRASDILLEYFPANEISCF